MLLSAERLMQIGSVRPAPRELPAAAEVVPLRRTLPWRHGLREGWHRPCSLPWWTSISVQQYGQYVGRTLRDIFQNHNEYMRMVLTGAMDPQGTYHGLLNNKHWDAFMDYAYIMIHLGGQFPP